jgi:DNA-binding GntR family transcriptional regulator
MPSTLRTTLERLTTTFAEAVYEAMRNASLDEILNVSQAAASSSRAAPAKAAGTRGRRSKEDISATAAKIVALVTAKKSGMRAEAIRAELGVAQKDLALPLARALATKKLRKSGAKRATTYFAR